MKNLRILSILVVLSISCAVSGNIGGVVSQARGKNTPTTVLSTVTSPNGLRLRDRPDNTGSQEWTIIPFGGEWHPYYCRDIHGTKWSFGWWRDDDGIYYVGYVAARFLSGGCDG